MGRAVQGGRLFPVHSRMAQTFWKETARVRAGAGGGVGWGGARPSGEEPFWGAGSPVVRRPPHLPTHPGSLVH